MAFRISIEESIKENESKIEKIVKTIEEQKIKLNSINNKEETNLCKYPNLIKQFSPEELKELIDKVQRNEENKLNNLEKQLELELNKYKVLSKISEDITFKKFFDKYTGVTETFSKNLEKAIEEKAPLIMYEGEIYKFKGYTNNYERMEIISLSRNEEEKNLISISNGENKNYEIIYHNGFLESLKKEFKEKMTPEEKVFLSDVKQNKRDLHSHITTFYSKDIEEKELTLKEGIIGLKKFKENPNAPLIKVKLNFYGDFQFSLLNGKEINQIVTLGEKEFSKIQIEKTIENSEQICKKTRELKEIYTNQAKTILLSEKPLSNKDNGLKDIDYNIEILNNIEKWATKANLLLKNEHKELFSLKNSDNTIKEKEDVKSIQKVMYAPKKDNSLKKGMKI